MPFRLLFVLSALAAALPGCSSPRKAPECSGPSFVLNEGLWTPPAGAPPK